MRQLYSLILEVIPGEPSEIKPRKWKCRMSNWGRRGKAWVSLFVPSREPSTVSISLEATPTIYFKVDGQESQRQNSKDQNANTETISVYLSIYLFNQ